MSQIRTFSTNDEVEKVLVRLQSRDISEFVRNAIIEKGSRMPQAVILCGGLGTRLYPITREIPKSMVIIKGKPFLEHQIELLKKNGIYDVVLCVGHMADQIKKYFGDGSKFGIKISYGKPQDSKYDTGGVIKGAEQILAGHFFVMYGDSYLPINFTAVMRNFLLKGKKGLMTVWKNFDKYDKSNVNIKDGFVVGYDKTAGFKYVDFGLSVLDKTVITQMPDNTKFTLNDMFKMLIEKKELAAYEVDQRFYEIGSFTGLKDFEETIKV